MYLCAFLASGEDPQCTTPKSGRKNDMGGHYSHPTTPQSTVPSPGAASLSSVHDEYGEISSPSWTSRTPASPVKKLSIFDRVLLLCVRVVVYFQIEFD